MTRRSVAGILGLVAVSLLVFGVALGNPFYFDDWYILDGNSWLAGGVPLTHWFRSPFADRAAEFPAYRPLLMMSFAANVRALGSSPEAFRWVNLLLHVINAWFVVQLFLLLLRGRVSRGIAWAAGFFFLLHPIQTLPVNFLWKRSELLQVTFVLFALFLHLRERLRDAPYRWGVVAAESILFLLATATKESGVILLPLLLFSDVALGRVRREDFGGRAVVLYGSLVALAAFYLWFRLGVVDGWLASHVSFAGDSRRLLGRLPYLIASLQVLPRYLSLWLIPRPLLLDDPLPLTSFPWGGATASLLLLALSLLLFLRFRRQPDVVFSLGLFWIGLAPTTGPFPLFLVMDQVRLYLPLAGLSMLLARALSELSNRVGFRPAWLLVAVAFSYGSASFLQNLRYRSPTLIWGDVTEAYPASGIAWEASGTSLERVGRSGEARRAFEMAARVEPEAPAFRIYPLLNRLEEASAEERREILDGIRTEELDGRRLSNLATWEADHGEEGRAEAHLLEVTRRYPTFFHAHYNLGVLFERRGNLEMARRAYANAAALDPADPRARAATKRLGKPKGD